MALAAAIAALVRHLVDPAGGQPGIDRQGLADEGQEGIELRTPPPSLLPRHPGCGQNPVDGRVMNPELACDRADQPLLGVIQAQDLGAGLVVDGHLTPLAPDGGPNAASDRPRGRSTGRSGRIGTPGRAGPARRVACPSAPPASPPEENAAALRSKGDACTFFSPGRFPGARQLAAFAVAPLALRMLVTAPPAVLAAPSGKALRVPPRSIATTPGAVDVAVVAAPAKDDLTVTGGADEQAGGVLHRDR